MERPTKCTSLTNCVLVSLLVLVSFLSLLSHVFRSKQWVHPQCSLRLYPQDARMQHSGMVHLQPVLVPLSNILSWCSELLQHTGASCRARLILICIWDDSDHRLLGCHNPRARYLFYHSSIHRHLIIAYDN